MAFEHTKREPLAVSRSVTDKALQIANFTGGDPEALREAMDSAWKSLGPRHQPVLRELHASLARVLGKAGE